MPAITSIQNQARGQTQDRHKRRASEGLGTARDYTADENRQADLHNYQHLSRLTRCSSVNLLRNKNKSCLTFLDPFNIQPFEFSLFRRRTLFSLDATGALCTRLSPQLCQPAKAEKECFLGGTPLPASDWPAQPLGKFPASLPALQQ